jgi:hypothetical protein
MQHFAVDTWLTRDSEKPASQNNDAMLATVESGAYDINRYVDILFIRYSFPNLIPSANMTRTKQISGVVIR